MVAFYFLDSSALVKRYVQESGSDWIRELPGIRNGFRIMVSRIAWVEVLSALSRLRREKKLSQKRFDQEARVFERHFKTEYQIVELDQAVIELAGSLVGRYPLRAYDSVQLASAIKMNSRYSSVEFWFVTADKRLHSVAESEGLFALDPAEQ